MASILSRPQCVNTLMPRQNGRHFPGGTFKWIFLNKNILISIKIRCRSGDKPLSEPMIGSLVTHIWVTRPRRVKSTCNLDGYICDYYPGALFKSSHYNSFEYRTPVDFICWKCNTRFSDWYNEHLRQNRPRVNATVNHWWQQVQVNHGSGKITWCRRKTIH